MLALNRDDVSAVHDRRCVKEVLLALLVRCVHDVEQLEHLQDIDLKTFGGFYLLVANGKPHLVDPLPIVDILSRMLLHRELMLFLFEPVEILTQGLDDFNEYGQLNLVLADFLLQGPLDGLSRVFAHRLLLVRLRWLHDPVRRGLLVLDLDIDRDCVARIVDRIIGAFGLQRGCFSALLFLLVRSEAIVQVDVPVGVGRSQVLQELDLQVLIVVEQQAGEPDL